MFASRAAHACVRVLAAALLALVLLAPAVARARVKLPPLDGHVVDTSGQLSRGDIAILDSRLEGFRRQTGFAIVALVVGSLDDEPIEDVAYRAFNEWGVGEKGKDNGVLIVVSTVDRRVHIETGKGVGGAITDLQSNDIINEKMAPLLKVGRVRDAIDAGASAVADALMKGSTPAERSPPSQYTPGAGKPVSPLTIGIGVIVVIVVIVLLIVSPTFRSIFLYLLQMFLWFGGRGGGGGDGGSGYSGGGGRSGGGGSSDSY